MLLANKSRQGGLDINFTILAYEDTKCPPERTFEKPWALSGFQFRNEQFMEGSTFWTQKTALVAVKRNKIDVRGHEYDRISARLA